MIKDWKKKKFAGELAWKNEKTGVMITLYFWPKDHDLFYNPKHKVGTYDVFIYNKERTTRDIPIHRTKLKDAVEFVKQYMRTH